MATYGTFVDGVSLKASEANDFLTSVLVNATAYQGTTNIASGTNNMRYAVVNKLVICHFSIGFSTTGTAGNAIEVGLPVTAASSGTAHTVGTATFSDRGALDNDPVLCKAILYSTTRLRFLTNSAVSTTTYLGQTNGPAITIANNDGIRGVVWYEAA